MNDVIEIFSLCSQRMMNYFAYLLDSGQELTGGVAFS